MWDDVDSNHIYNIGEAYDSLLTGYGSAHYGDPILLYAGNPGGPIEEGHYFSINLPPLGDPQQAPLTGGDWYREWIAFCAPFPVCPGDSVQLEPGQMVGPTVQGIADLIAQDPTASWNPFTRSVEGSYFGVSPRIAHLQAYNPEFPPISGHNYVKITKILTVFLESVGPGSRVTVRLLEATPSISMAFNPGSCPAQLSGKKQGLLPFALLGSPLLDVGSIDQASLLVNGFPIVHIDAADEVTPFVDLLNPLECEKQGCSVAANDGYVDLLFKVESEELILGLMPAASGQRIKIIVTGLTMSGVPFSAGTSVTLLKGPTDQIGPICPHLEVGL